MAGVAHTPYLEKRPSGFFFRRRIPRLKDRYQTLVQDLPYASACGPTSSPKRRSASAH